MTTMIGGEVCKQRLVSQLLPAEPRGLTRAEIDGLWRIFVAIGTIWKNTVHDSAGLKSSWLEFLTEKTMVRPSYVAEYVNALEVVEELITMYEETEAFEKLFLDNGIPPNSLDTRLAHAKLFVVDEFIRVQVVAGGFKNFIRPHQTEIRPENIVNYNGFIAGSRFNSDQARSHIRGPLEMSNDYAYIIVGSGVAGSTIATKLLEAHPETPILMLEAGPQVPMKDRRYWWDYVLYGRKAYDPCEDRDSDNPSVGGTPWHSNGSRTMMYGGSTVHWGGWSMRFKPEDFYLKTNTGQGGDWPYDYDTLEPYYCRADEYLSVCGDDSDSADRMVPASAQNKNDPWRSKPYPLPPYPWTESDGEMIQAFRELGIKPGRMPIARYRKCMATGTCKYCPFGARFSGSFILDDLLSEPKYTNLKFIGMAPVTRLVAESKRRIHAVEYIDPVTGETVTATGDRIILCSGAYEAPKLLMLSGSRFWEKGIGNDHDLVGRYAVSHPFLSVVGTKPKNEERWIQEFDFPSLMSRTYDTEQYQQNGKIFLMKFAGLPNVDIAKHMIAGKSRAQIDDIVTGPRQVQLSAFMEETGQYANRFSLGEGTTRFGLPRTKIDFTLPPDFQERANKNLDLMEAVIRQMGYTVDKNTDRKIGDQDGHHTSSTCRMGKDPTEGVVDADLKVFGTDNLYVCSNAAHPTCAAVNPTLTLVAVTLKLTDHLLTQTS